MSAQQSHWRTARATDDAALIAMSVAYYAEDPSPHAPTAANMQRTIAALRADPGRGRAAVLELDGRPAGYALLISYWSNELGGDICTIDELYVEPAARSQGHSTALLEALAAHAAPYPPGAVALALEVTAKNARARALYERLGFAPGNLTLRRRTAP